IAKLYSGEMSNRVVNWALQVHGGYGYMDEFAISRLYRDQKILEIDEGTNEVQRMVIARHLGLWTGQAPRAPVPTLIADAAPRSASPPGAVHRGLLVGGRQDRDQACEDLQAQRFPACCSDLAGEASNGRLHDRPALRLRADGLPHGVGAAHRRPSDHRQRRSLDDHPPASADAVRWTLPPTGRLPCARAVPRDRRRVSAAWWPGPQLPALPGRAGAGRGETEAPRALPRCAACRWLHLLRTTPA